MKTQDGRITRGELARRAGVNLETVRFYEGRGLVPAPARNTAGYRLYREEDVRRLEFIRRGQDLGFTLREIRELLRLRAEPRRDRSRVKRLAEEKIRDIEGKINDLKRMRKALASISSSCDGHGELGGCPILKALDGAVSVRTKGKGKRS